MSDNYKKVKKYYDKGLWSIDWVRKAVGRWITEEEFKEITGMDFEPKGE